MKKLSLILAALLLAACGSGGGSGDTSTPDTTPAPPPPGDVFTKYVRAEIASAPDDTEGLVVEALFPTLPEDTEPESI
ncbi:MAG: hypothetical protein V4857_05560 [Pseudomonadota bacterium]